MDSVMKGLMGTIPPPQNFWARIAPGCHRKNVWAFLTHADSVYAVITQEQQTS